MTDAELFMKIVGIEELEYHGEDFNVRGDSDGIKE